MHFFLVRGKVMSLRCGLISVLSVACVFVVHFEMDGFVLSASCTLLWTVIYM